MPAAPRQPPEATPENDPKAEHAAQPVIVLSPSSPKSAVDVNALPAPDDAELRGGGGGGGGEEVLMALEDEEDEELQMALAISASDV